MRIKQKRLYRLLAVSSIGQEKGRNIFQAKQMDGNF